MSSLTAAERELCRFLDDRVEDQIALARRLIAIPSPNPPGNERAVADFVAEQLSELGITDVAEHGTDPSRPNLVVRVEGVGEGPTLLLSGHLDTKPAGDMNAWETDPWDPVIRDGVLIGLGSGDMKVAVAAIMFAAAALRNHGAFNGELQLVFTADEEAGSIVGSKWMAEAGLLQADVAVIGEPSGITREWEAIHLVSRGAALFKIKILGTQMHSSVSDRLPAINATVEMARLIDRMDREFRDRVTFEPHPLCPLGPTVNVGVMAEAGVFYGVYPGNAEFACDIRTLPGMSQEQLEADIRGFLDDAMRDDSDLRAELDFEIWVPPTEIAPDNPAVRALQAAAADILDEPPRLDAFPGATDAPHFQLTAGIPTVAAFGPGLLPRAHSPNEHLAVDSIGQASKIYALAAWRYLSEG